MPTPEEITRHHDEGEPIYVGSYPRGYVVRIEEPDPTWPQHYAEIEGQISAVLDERLLDHPEDRELYAAAKHSALARLDATGEDPEALGFGMRYNRVKQPVVREIYDRMFRAAGLL